MTTISFDGLSKIIDIGYESLTTTVQVVVIYSRWKDWVMEGNAQWDEAFELSVGGNALGGGVDLDAYIFLRNDLGWRIRAADIDHTLVVEGQLFGTSAVTAVYLPRPGRTINVRESQSSRSQIVRPDSDAITAATGFQGAVWIDPTSAYSSIVYPTGTSVQPVNNWAAAVQIANTYGIKTIKVIGSPPLVGADVSGFHIIAEAPSTVLYIDPSATVVGVTFESMGVTGTADGSATFYRCGIDGLLSANGNFVDSVFSFGGLTINGDVYASNCTSGIPDDGHSSIYFDGGVYQVQIRGFTGALSIHGMATGSFLSVDFHSGHLTIDGDCTDGTAVVRGVVAVTDLSGGAVTVDTVGVLSPASVTAEVWTAPKSTGTEGTMGFAIKVMEAVLRNRVVTNPTLGTYTVFDDNDVALMYGLLWEDAAGTVPYSGAGAERRDRLG